MIQRISVRILIEQDNRPLLVRRADGRPNILGKYELPGGRLVATEQPDDAVKRFLRDDLGIYDRLKLELVDSITYIDADDRDIKYAVTLYRVTITEKTRISLSNHYNKFVWYRAGRPDPDRLTELAQIILGAEKPEIAESDFGDYVPRLPVIYTDGGSRGNPGPSAAGVALVDNKDQVVDQGGEYLGITTNNQAEYQAVRIGLKMALARGWTSVELRADSLLVINQLKGVYTVKNRELWPIYDNVLQLIGQFDEVKFTHIPRELNQIADGMVNKTLDAQRDLRVGL